MGTRRQLFLSGLLTAAGGALAWAWASLGLLRRGREGLRTLVLARPSADGITFEQGVVLVRRGAELRAFSARCPHLGCRINRVEEGVLVCPCHGSRFDSAGGLLAGPAAAGLSPLEVEAQGPGGRITVVRPS